MKKVSENDIVSIYYNVTDDDGNIVDGNDGFEPLQYLHGAGNILPALEDGLKGALENDIKIITVQADQQHSLTPKQLHFNVTIAGIRPATGKELLSGRPLIEEKYCGPDCACY